jgi:hypothetical protein
MIVFTTLGGWEWHGNGFEINMTIIPNPHVFFRLKCCIPLILGPKYRIVGHIPLTISYYSISSHNAWFSLKKNANVNG